MVAAGILANRTMMTGLVIGVSALVFVLLWFFADGFSTSVADGLNGQAGGWTLVIVYIQTILLAALAYIYRSHPVYIVLGLFLILALVASFGAMMINPADAV